MYWPGSATQLDPTPSADSISPGDARSPGFTEPHLSSACRSLSNEPNTSGFTALASAVQEAGYGVLPAHPGAFGVRK